MPTTTEVARNIPSLRALLAQGIADGITHATLVEIGPGAAVWGLANGLKRPSLDAHPFQSLSFGFVRNIETVVRKLPLVPLTSIEPREIVQLLQEDRFRDLVQRLVIIDRDSRVGKAALESLLDASIQHSFERFDLNGTMSWQHPRVKLVAVYHCLERSKDPALSLHRVKGILVQGGLLSTTLCLEDPDFEVLEPVHGLYRYRGTI